MANIRNIYFHDDVAVKLMDSPNISRLINEVLRKHFKYMESPEGLKEKADKLAEETKRTQKEYTDKLASEHNLKNERTERLKSELTAIQHRKDKEKEEWENDPERLKRVEKLKEWAKKG